MPKFKREQASAIVILIVAIWINLEMTLAKGAIYSFTKQLPIIKSLHVNARFTAAFIVPFVIVGTFQVDRYFANKRSVSLFCLVAFLGILSLLSYFSLSADLHSRYFDLSPLKELQRQIQNGNTFPINRISNVGDLDTFLQNASSYETYEVLFGYQLESFTPETHPGSVFEEDQGYFNMTNPASLVFPELNHTYPFQRIAVSERQKLETFLHRKQPDWQIPTAQKFMDVLSLITLIFCVGAPTIRTIKRITSKRSVLV